MTIRASTFLSGPRESLAVEDAYDAPRFTELSEVVKRAVPSASLSDLGIPPNKLFETSVDTDFRREIERGGRSLLETVRDIRTDLPKNASLGDILESNKLSEVGVAIRRLSGSLPGGDFGNLNGEDLGFLIKQTNSLTSRILSGDSNLSIDDLKDANGVDYVVAAAVGIMTVRKAMGKENRGILGILETTALPAMLRDGALDSLLDIAAEFGLEDVVSSLFEMIGERAKKKKEPTIRRLLANFRYSNKPVVTELSSTNRSLLVSVSEMFGLSSANSNVLAEVVEASVYDEEYLTKEQQSINLVDTLYKVDSAWNTAKRNGEVIPKLDNYRFANASAEQALILDPRTRIDMLIVNDRQLRPQTWQRVAGRWYPDIYL